MRRLFPAAVLLLACGAQAPQPPSRAVEGRVEVPVPGDAYLFLSEPGEGPPEPPLYATAVPQVRLASGDGRFVFADVAAGAYRLWGFVDVQRELRTDEPLLAQPGAGDRRLVPLELSVEGGLILEAPVALGEVETADPPAFLAEGLEGEVQLPDRPLQPLSIRLRSTEVERVGGAGFEVSLADVDGDGAADDADGDGLPDLFPQAFLRFRPRPGQTVPLDSRGRPAEVVVPLRYPPGEFLLALGGDPAARLTAFELNTFLIPQATAVFREPGGRRVTTTLEAIPVGDYELVLLSERGQVWRIPNGLPQASQGTRFTFVHGTGL